MLWDTDSDGLGDRNEINNIGIPSNHALDPTYADTDGDGFKDNVDKYYGDMMLHVRFYYFSAWEDINWGSVHNIFFTLTYYDDVTQQTVTLSTTRLNGVHTGDSYSFAFDYYHPR